MSESCRCDAQYCRVSCTCLPGKEVSLGSNAQVKVSSQYTYTHNVDTCACGTCHKSRVDSGTQDSYMKRVRAKVNEILKDNQEHKPFVCQCANCKGFTAKKAAVISDSHGKQSEDAKAIFAAMGTPFDSKCPHSLPSYACMSCSH